MSYIIIRCISVSKHAILKIFFVSNVLWIKEFVRPSPICVTLTDNLEIQGHMILHMTLPISASTHAIATNLFFLILYGSGNLLQLLPYAWRWRMTLKFKVPWFWTWPYLSHLLHIL